jgi:hypothetical protein
MCSSFYSIKFAQVQLGRNSNTNVSDEVTGGETAITDVIERGSREDRKTEQKDSQQGLKKPS